jgi:hypothetical protein
MRPQTIGRVLGTGVRVAGRIASEHLAGTAHPAGQQMRPQEMRPQAQPIAEAAARVREVRQAAERARGGVASGIGGFLRPFRRVGGILWLEVTGVFFLLPAIVFAPNLWRMRASWAHGPDHRTFLVTVLVVVVFLYLGVSSFWRARRK